jgi:Rab-like protein 5
MEQDFKINNRIEKSEIELWDCSGDLKYDNCWPALSDDSNGVVFVLNPNEAHHAKELNQWYTFFVKDAGLREEVCLVISNRFTTEDGSGGKSDAKLCK